jgi:hypothetical protein
MRHRFDQPPEPHGAEVPGVQPWFDSLLRHKAMSRSSTGVTTQVTIGAGYRFNAFLHFLPTVQS